VDQYGVDGVMIGRGIFKNPFAFAKEPKNPSSQELLDLLRLHLALFDKYSKLEPRPFKPLRRFFKIYVSGFKGARELRNQLLTTESTDEARALIETFSKSSVELNE